jgi:hypothetical protein
MLVATYSALIREPEGLRRNALVESYALHARNLFEFLTDANTRSDAIRLEAFGVTPPTVDGELRDRLGRLYGYASSRVAHLSWARTANNPGAPTGDLAAFIDLFLEFTRQIEGVPLDEETASNLDAVRRWRHGAATSRDTTGPTGPSAPSR